jgi:hypothetical protein
MKKKTLKMKNGTKKKTLKRKNGEKTKHGMNTFVFFLYLISFEQFFVLFQGSYL